MQQNWHQFHENKCTSFLGCNSKNFLVTTTTKTSTKVRIRVFFLSCLFICFLHPSVTILPELDCRNCSKDICGIVFPQIPPCYKYSSLSLPFKREKCLANEIFPRSISRSRFSSSSSGREDQESSLWWCCCCGFSRQEKFHHRRS